MRLTIGFCLAPAMFVVGAAAAQGAAYVDVPVQGRENVSYAYADVLRANPTYETVHIIDLREECREETPVSRMRDEPRMTGSIVSGLSAMARRARLQEREAAREAAEAAELAEDGADEADPRCQMVEVPREERRISGYDVEYRYKGELYMSHMDYDPGNKLRVRVTVAPAD
ncbi:MAG: hypothetical protein WDA70_04485 [Lysobacteraceae bacterium]